MASSNNVTPTNCSWWPISAMEDEDGQIPDGEDSEERNAEPRPFSKDRLVLYHWTQSFSSQKGIFSMVAAQATCNMDLIR
ncbi:unnamed protein product [Arctogadus glacialis]